jgi:lipoyl(octanoyl) transferase
MPSRSRLVRTFFCGKRSYPMMLALQEEIFQRRIKDVMRMNSQPCSGAPAGDLPPPDTILAVEHSEPVYTIGRRDTSRGLPAGTNDSVPVVQTRRGGGITWHGPGQLTVYPIANIKRWWEMTSDARKNRSPIRWYSDVLESSMCKTIEGYGVPSEIGCVGVWVPGVHEGQTPRKIGSIGLQLSNWISMHGIGLNVANDLKYFDNIVMCEMPNKRATSLHQELALRLLPSALPTVGDVWPRWLKAMELSLCIEGLDVQCVDASSWPDDALTKAVLGL